MKDKIIAVVLFIVMILNCFDVVADIHLGVPLWHILEESLIVLISGLCAVYVMFEMHKRGQKLHGIAARLAHADQELENITEDMRAARSQYSEVIHQQFKAWALTEGEQQVGLLLLKGLSFKEIAEVRSTKEKTVRQQASALYAKAGLEGRHEFSAWFLEDFLSHSQAKEVP
jgi:DNA-binding CsgD family transcriptional regulator